MTTRTDTSIPDDIYGHHARHLLEDFHKREHKAHRDRHTRAPTERRIDPTLPVGILGAGAGGLYTAMILEDLEIPYRIIEGRAEEGGRLFTHRFPDSTGAPYNYYDVGAMRFPDIPAMTRVFKLFRSEALNSDGIALAQRLQKFYFSSKDGNAFLSYNNITHRSNAVPAGDPFRSYDVIYDTNPVPYVETGTTAILDDVIEPFAVRLLNDLETGSSDGWRYMQSFDHYSARAYMSTKYIPSDNLPKLPKAHLTNDLVSWIETFDNSSGGYDLALSETVLDAVAFGWEPGNPPPTDWYCIDGGAQEIARAMGTYIRRRKPDAFLFNTKVTALKPSINGIDVTTNPVTQERYVRTPEVPPSFSASLITKDIAPPVNTVHHFTHVISTLPLPVVRTLEMGSDMLTPMQSNALRELSYSPSTKIGLQFKTAWWTTATNRAGQRLNIIGGQTYNDKTIRTVVYPSFGDVLNAKTTTLIASYCWTEDALRMGANIGKDDNALVNRIVGELAEIHNLDFAFIFNDLIGYNAWDWNQDPWTMGAYALFGPGKFVNLYASLNAPASDGFLHFAGEAISVRHAWVEGALDSAWRAVAEMLLCPPFASNPALLRKFFQNWGTSPEWLTSKYLKHPRNQRGAPKEEDSLLFTHLKHMSPELFEKNKLSPEVLEGVVVAEKFQRFSGK